MDESTLARKVLELVNASNYQPVKPKVIAKKLGLGKDDAARVRRRAARRLETAFGSWRRAILQSLSSQGHTL